MVRFRCKYCGGTINTPDDYTDKMAKCPECGHRTAVPIITTEDIVGDHTQDKSGKFVHVHDAPSPPLNGELLVSETSKSGRSLLTFGVVFSVIGIILMSISVVHFLLSQNIPSIDEDKIEDYKRQIEEWKASDKKQLAEIDKLKKMLSSKDKKSQKQTAQLGTEKRDMEDRYESLSTQIESLEEELVQLEVNVSDYFETREPIDETKEGTNNKTNIFVDATTIAKTPLPMARPPIVLMSFSSGFGNTTNLLWHLDLEGEKQFFDTPEKRDTFYFDGIVHGNVKLVDVQAIPGTPAKWHGKAAYFDGRDSYIEIPTMPLHLSSFAISLWVKTMSRANYGIVEQKDSDSPFEWFRIQTIDNRQPYMSFHGSNFHGSDTKCTDELNNNWHHLVFQYDYDDGEQEIWVDGKRRMREYTPSFRGSKGKMYIGKAAEFADGNTLSFYGFIDDFRIYLRVLSEGEIIGMMASQHRILREPQRRAFFEKIKNTNGPTPKAPLPP